MKKYDESEIDVDIYSELETEMDEMWSFYHDKSHQIWLWWAVDHKTNTPIAFWFGTREHKNLDKLIELLKPYKIGKVYADNNFAYEKRFSSDILVTGKKNTQQIERDHLTLRTRIKRLARKTICFSKSEIIHKIVIGLFINERILIENINAKIKVFKIMKYPYRNRRKRHFLRLNLVCGIINYELQS